jgi:hypothetical protein
MEITEGKKRVTFSKATQTMILVGKAHAWFIKNYGLLMEQEQKTDRAFRLFLDRVKDVRNNWALLDEAQRKSAGNIIVSGLEKYKSYPISDKLMMFIKDLEKKNISFVN